MHFHWVEDIIDPVLRWRVEMELREGVGGAGCAVDERPVHNDLNVRAEILELRAGGVIVDGPGD